MKETLVDVLVSEGVKSRAVTVSIISVHVCTPRSMIFYQEIQSIDPEISGKNGDHVERESVNNAAGKHR
jgi:hypothetical protein